MLLEGVGKMNNRIKAFRELQILSQGQLAILTNISQKRISQIENSLVDPSLKEIIRFLKIFNCKFEELFGYEEEHQMSKNILIKYTHRGKGHVDPNFTHLVYGDSGKRAVRLRNIVSEGSLVFFHTSIGGNDYITGYFQTEKVLNRGQDDLEIDQLPSDIDAKVDEILIIGKREGSKILTSPLLFDKKLAMQLTSLGITEAHFEGSVSELSALTSATREHRELSTIDAEILKQKCVGRG